MSIDWSNLIGEKIFVILKSEHHYKGIVKEVENNLISITDKFGEYVILDTSDIKVLKKVPD